MIIKLSLFLFGFLLKYKKIHSKEGHLTAMKRSLAAVSCKVSQDVGKGGTDGANRLPGDWKMSKLLEFALDVIV